MSFFKLKTEHSDKSFPWPTLSDVFRTITLSSEDILTKQPEPKGAWSGGIPGTYMVHTGIGCFNIWIPEEWLDEYTGWPRLSLAGGPYGQYEEPKLVVKP